MAWPKGRKRKKNSVKIDNVDFRGLKKQALRSLKKIDEDFDQAEVSGMTMKHPQLIDGGVHEVLARKGYFIAPLWDGRRVWLDTNQGTFEVIE